jgi:hypothetical protein
MANKQGIRETDQRIKGLYGRTAYSRRLRQVHRANEGGRVAAAGDEFRAFMEAADQFIDRMYDEDDVKQEE